MGKFKKGGKIDFDKAARLVINDWNEGKLKYCTIPPNMDEYQAETVYTQSNQMMDD